MIRSFSHDAEGAVCVVTFARRAAPSSVSRLVSKFTNLQYLGHAPRKPMLNDVCVNSHISDVMFNQISNGKSQIGNEFHKKSICLWSSNRKNYLKFERGFRMVKNTNELTRRSSMRRTGGPRSCSCRATRRSRHRGSSRCSQHTSIGSRVSLARGVGLTFRKYTGGK